MNTEDRLVALETRLRAAEDQLEIIRLLNTYGPAVDSGASRPAAELWIEGGIYNIGGVGAVTALVDGANLAMTIATKGISTASIGEFEQTMREFAGMNIRRSYIGGRKLFGQRPFEECSQYVG